MACSRSILLQCSMSSWLNPKFRRTPATSRAYVWPQARGFISSNRWGFSLEEKALRRAGMDYWERCDVRIWRSFEVLRQQSSGARFLFLTKKAKRPYWMEEFEHGDHLVFGRETKGLPESLLAANTEHCLTIPMRQEARSLNLATAAGIVLYEAIRQLRAL